MNSPESVAGNPIMADSRAHGREGEEVVTGKRKTRWSVLALKTADCAFFCLPLTLSER